MANRKLKTYWELLKQAFNGFLDDNALKLSASLSYYTVFSLSPMLIIIISICSLFFGEEAVQGQITGQIRSLVGQEAAVQIQDLIRRAQLSNQSGLAAYMQRKASGETLEAYLDRQVFAGAAGTTVTPDPRDVAGFNTFIERYKKGLGIERAAVDGLK